MNRRIMMTKAFDKEAEFEKEAKEYAIENYEACLYDDFPYTNDARAREQSFKDGAETGYSRATGDAKRIIYNLLDVLMYLEGTRVADMDIVKEGTRVADMDIVKEAKQYLKEA